MKKKLFSILCAGLMLTACGQQNKNEITMDFTDDVQVALADSGHIDLNSLQWTREPKAAHLLSLPERQCARIADEDPREILQFCGEDRFYKQSSPF